MSNSLRREKSYPACGRLVVLQTVQGNDLLSQLSADSNFSGFTAINFPAMPESIELARTADYNVSSPWGFPDGIHFYKGTQPLSIPLSFKLHAFDKEYCPQGAKSLLQIAADLQALVLPFGPSAVTVAYGYGSTAVNQTNQKATAAEGTSDYKTTPENIFPPATCYLELMITERGGVGICCVGYVKEVRVRLFGPYLKGPGISQNLPTNGEFEFTFVHHPGHNNAYTPNTYDQVGEQQAYAKTVKENLYNTVNLLTNPSAFKSFNDSTAPTTNQTNEPAASAAPAPPATAPVTTPSVTPPTIAPPTAPVQPPGFFLTPPDPRLGT